MDLTDWEYAGIERQGVFVATFKLRAGGIETRAHGLWSDVGGSQDGVQNAVDHA
jgi:hypothetical protein